MLWKSKRSYIDDASYDILLRRLSMPTLVTLRPPARLFQPIREPEFHESLLPSFFEPLVQNLERGGTCRLFDQSEALFPGSESLLWKQRRDITISALHISGAN